MVIISSSRKQKQKALWGELAERATSQKPLLGGERAERQNCEGTQKKKGGYSPSVCRTCQISIDGSEEDDLA